MNLKSKSYHFDMIACIDFPKIVEGLYFKYINFIKEYIGANICFNKSKSHQFLDDLHLIPERIRGILLINSLFTKINNLILQMII